MTDQISLLAPVLVLFAAALGTVLGSFLNVVVYRVPAGLSVVRPASACPACAAPIRARDNIPVLSWLLLRGRCRDCAAPIRVRYPLVEAATGGLFALVTWWTLPTHAALTPALLYLTAIGVALFLIDLDCKRLPDQIVLPSYPVVAGLLAAAALAAGEWPLGRVGLSALVWFLVFAVPWFATAGRGMGFGDVKLAPLLGAGLGAVGWGASLVGLLAGFVFGAAVGVGLVLFASAGRKTKIPYGPFMLAGALFGLLAGPTLWTGYLSVMGLG